ncbi:MAG: AMP-binding protein [Puniceicoccales bacterium]|nr:AMP-binding protein [Puniceicoccales bacterium]
MTAARPPNDRTPPPPPPTAVSNAARHLREAAQGAADFCALRAPVGDAPDNSEIRYSPLTFAQLDRDSDAAAELFSRRGITAGSKTLLLAKPGLDLILSMFALLKIGAVPVAIDPGMGFRPFLKCVAATRPTALVGAPAALLLTRLFWKTFAGVRARVATGGAFRRAIAKISAAATGPRPLFPAAPETSAAILFTSGSTGAPKGAVHTHGSLDAQLALVRDTYGIRAGDVDFPMLPVFALFDPALGTTAVIPELNPSRPAAADPERIVRALRQNRVTYSFGSPVLWSKIARHCDARSLTLPDLRVALAAGAPVPVGLLRLLKKILPNAKIHTPYGATEALPVCSIEADEVLGTGGTGGDEHGTFRETLRGGGTCVGHPVAGVEVKIIAATDGVIPTLADARELPAGTVGEIIVRSPAMSLAYDNKPEATALAKIRATALALPCHRMGDMGRLDDAGRLWFYGRKAEVVRTAGGPLYTESVEPVFNQHPRVFRTALIGLGEVGAQLPALVVEPLAGEFPRAAAEREKFADELRALATGSAAAGRVTRFFFEHRLPVDPRHNAKIHRLALARKYSRQTARERAARPEKS